jgi:hypothetical protein
MAARQFASATTRSIKRATSELAAVAVRGWGFTTNSSLKKSLTD